MQMSKQKHLPLFLLVLLMAVFLPALLAVAQNEPPAEPRPAPLTVQTQQAEPEAETDQPATSQDSKKTDPATGTAARPLKEFKPTEKIGADSAVSFPVDI